MSALSADMQRLVSQQKLGFVATVGPDGMPNLSPKGTVDVWDDDHLWFADICSPQTTANISHGSWVAVNVVDPFVRKGYRFRGPATVHGPGTPEYADGTARMRAAGSALVDRVGGVVVIEVREAAPVTSPAYDDGTLTEADIRAIHTARFARLAEEASGG